jgi:hypothetical protein
MLAAVGAVPQAPVGDGLGGEVCGVKIADLRHVVRGRQLLLGELADRLQHGVPGVTAHLVDGDQ